MRRYDDSTMLVRGGAYVVRMGSGGLVVLAGKNNLVYECDMPCISSLPQLLCVLVPW
jgi:hypothetical protein